MFKYTTIMLIFIVSKGKPKSIFSFSDVLHGDLWAERTINPLVNQPTHALPTHGILTRSPRAGGDYRTPDPREIPFPEGEARVESMKTFLAFCTASI